MYKTEIQFVQQTYGYIQIKKSDIHQFMDRSLFQLGSWKNRNDRLIYIYTEKQIISYRKLF